MGIDVRGKIVLARYGGNFRGFKAKYAEAAGAAGLIIYTDPANGGYVNGPVYPDGNLQQCVGHTAWLPAHPQLFRRSADAVRRRPCPLKQTARSGGCIPTMLIFHTIPVTPIGYGAAEYIFTRMLGERLAPESWRGGFPFPYRLTGGRDLLVHLSVNQPQGLKPITNVVANRSGQ